MLFCLRQKPKLLWRCVIMQVQLNVLEKSFVDSARLSAQPR